MATVLNVYVDAKRKEAVAQIAESFGISQSAVAKMALAEYLDRHFYVEGNRYQQDRAEEMHDEQERNRR